MSQIGMSDLIAALFAAGGPPQLNAREHRSLHRALTTLRCSALDSTRLPVMSARTDPDVGTRIAGVTRAIWKLAAEGAVAVSGESTGARFVATDVGLTTGRRVIMQLGDADRNAVYRAAAIWARCDSVALKA